MATDPTCAHCGSTFSQHDNHDCQGDWSTMATGPKPVELTAYSPGQCCTDYCIPELGMHDEYEDTVNLAIAHVKAREAAAWDAGVRQQRAAREPVQFNPYRVPTEETP